MIDLNGQHGVTQQYKNSYEEGVKYQDFIAVKLNLCCYSSRQNQYDKGENTLGMEIKYDHKFQETLNIYLEIKEKTNATNYQFIESGINNTNHWLYLIGNYKLAFVFSSKMMRRWFEKSPDIFKKVETPTSIGYLLNLEQAEIYSIKKYYFI